MIFESVASEEHPGFTQAFKALNFYASKRVWHTRDNFQETDEVKSEALPIYAAGERNVTELLEAEKGHYVFEKDTLEEEVFEYMQTTNLFLPCYARK